MNDKDYSWLVCTSNWYAHGTTSVIIIVDILPSIQSWLLLVHNMQTNNLKRGFEKITHSKWQHGILPAKNSQHQATSLKHKCDFTLLTRLSHFKIIQELKIRHKRPHLTTLKHKVNVKQSSSLLRRILMLDYIQLFFFFPQQQLVLSAVWMYT